jgi:transketolase C-terminal domain/subunit
VKLFGVKGGPSYKFLGMSHNMTEYETDGIIDNLPHLTTYKLDDEDALKEAMKLEYERPGPAYFEI